MTDFFFFFKLLQLIKLIIKRLGTFRNGAPKSCEVVMGIHPERARGEYIWPETVQRASKMRKKKKKKRGAKRCFRPWALRIRCRINSRNSVA